MSGFDPVARTFTGTVVVPAPVDRAFPLFSPEGERRWVPGWDPERLHPPGAEWEEEMIFRTRDASGEAVWVVTRLARADHHVIYHRVEPGRYVARVEVRCRAADAGATEARVTYGFVGLSPQGNAAIEAMTQADYDARMRRWAGWIDACLAAGR